MRTENRLLSTLTPAVAVGLVALSLPYWLITQQYVLSVAMITVIWAIAAQGWNVIGGYGGLLSFGHSVFFGLGAYVTALLTIHGGLTPWLGMIVGALAAAVAGAVLTFPALRLRGVYFTLATFVLTLLVSDLTTHFADFTGGDQGLLLPFVRDDASAFQFGSKLTFYYVLVGFLAVATLVVSLVANSRLGLFLRASRDDPDAARAAGVNVTRVRLVGLMISAAVTSMAGSLMLEYLRFIDPITGFGSNTAFVIGLIALVGGRGTVLGPILGAAVLIPAQQVFSSTFADGPAGLSTMAYAVIVILIMVIDYRGLHHLIARLISALPRPTRTGGSRRSIPERSS